MQGSLDPGDDGIISEINITPLVDIILVLLIIFMMTANIILSPSQGLEINLPKASSGQAERIPEELTISIARDNSIYVENQKATPEDLRNRMRQAYERNKDTLVVVGADAHASWEKIVEVIDIAKEIGLDRLGFQTEAVEPKP